MSWGMERDMSRNIGGGIERRLRLENRGTLDE